MTDLGLVLPLRIERLEEAVKVVDANGKAAAYFYISAIEEHCSEGASGGLIGADDAADEILEAIPDPGENARLASFAREIISYVFDGTDADGGSIQALAVHYGLLERTLYDPKVHGPSFAEPGAEWFEYTGTLKLARTEA